METTFPLQNDLESSNVLLVIVWKSSDPNLSCAKGSSLCAYEQVLKKLKEFKPEFLLFSAGFDAHIDDPLAQLKLGSEDFYTITKRTLELSKSFCNGNVVSILEGGYDLKALQNSTKRHVDALIEFDW